MSPITVQYVASVLFAIAVLHTMSVYRFRKFASYFKDGSVGENFFHLMAEVEVVFGLWAAVFIAAYVVLSGPSEALIYLNSRDFREPAFVFAMMVIASTQPVLITAERCLLKIAAWIPLHRSIALYLVTLTLGPLLGSLITEPAAMTVTALVLFDYFYKSSGSVAFKYATLGLLFVNISIGGVLTPYAAPPVLIGAHAWQWDIWHMLSRFGWKAALACLSSTALVACIFREELAKISYQAETSLKAKIPPWVVCVHFFFMAAVILSEAHLALVIGALLFFIGFSEVTREYQTRLRIREGLLVGFFLGGLIILGGQQSWWLKPLVSELSTWGLYFGSIALTAFTDNAAIVYLGTQIPDMSEVSKYFLLAGSVTGGGLTVIANAPNPAGYSILSHSFGERGIEPLKLFLAALLPTCIAVVCFGIL